MEATLSPNTMADHDKRITETILRERGRLRSFIRNRLSDPGEADDILQDVFHELVEASRLPEPIEQLGAWLFLVARNRIIDRFRKKKEQQLPTRDDADDEFGLDDLLPSTAAGPEAAYAQSVLLAELHDAIDELPDEQREVFVAHELEWRSFKELSTESGVSVNTLLSRKRYAVLNLRRRLQAFYDDYDEIDQ